jgi:hypothetical protein
MLPWAGELAGRIDEHVIDSVLRRNPATWPCGATARRTG